MTRSPNPIAAGVAVGDAMPPSARIDRDDEAFMRLALAEAERALPLGEVPIGAVIVEGERVVARAHNLRETWRDPTAHAELIVLRRAARALDRWRLTGTTLYVTIEPCPMCAGALLLARVDRLVYGAADPKAGAAGSIVDLVRHSAFNHRLEVQGGVLAEPCGAIVRAFFSSRREARRGSQAADGGALEKR
ncbi:MAG TPA: tRNA adenosine(34) deaminase TadA [Limnochordia bacterium]